MYLGTILGVVGTSVCYEVPIIYTIPTMAQAWPGKNTAKALYCSYVGQIHQPQRRRDNYGRSKDSSFTVKMVLTRLMA